MSTLVEWFQRIAGYGPPHRPPLIAAEQLSEDAEWEGPESDWTWIAMFPGDMPVGLMEILVRSDRRHLGGSDTIDPRL